jgi:hypothetical protein
MLVTCKRTKLFNFRLFSSLFSMIYFRTSWQSFHLCVRLMVNCKVLVSAAGKLVEQEQAIYVCKLVK